MVLHITCVPLFTLVAEPGSATQALVVSAPGQLCEVSSSGLATTSHQLINPGEANRPLFMVHALLCMFSHNGSQHGPAPCHTADDGGRTDQHRHVYLSDAGWARPLLLSRGRETAWPSRICGTNTESLWAPEVLTGVHMALPLFRLPPLKKGTTAA